MLVTKNWLLIVTKSFTSISNFSPTVYVSNIRHQHWRCREAATVMLVRDRKLTGECKDFSYNYDIFEMLQSFYLLKFLLEPIPLLQGSTDRFSKIFRSWSGLVLDFYFLDQTNWIPVLTQTASMMKDLIFWMILTLRKQAFGECKMQQFLFVFFLSVVPTTLDFSDWVYRV